MPKIYESFIGKGLNFEKVKNSKDLGQTQSNNSMSELLNLEKLKENVTSAVITEIANKAIKEVKYPFELYNYITTKFELVPNSVKILNGNEFELKVNTDKKIEILKIAGLKNKSEKDVELISPKVFTYSSYLAIYLYLVIGLIFLIIVFSMM
tara:strand:- start:373 stop:828 length:456 start_codon:yes stop_codon:yes gene_type:complete